MLRHVIALALGAIATIGLLKLMQSVIDDPRAAGESSYQGDVVDFVRLLEEREAVARDRTPEPPKPPDKPPPNPPLPVIVDVDGRGIEITEPGDYTPMIEDDVGRFVADGDHLPIVRVGAVYPARALERNIEGYVVVEFVVTQTGTVRNPVVIVADPPGYFERAALTAVQKFKYKPRIFDGKAEEVPGVRNRIVFELED